MEYSDQPKIHYQPTKFLSKSTSLRLPLAQIIILLGIAVSLSFIITYFFKIVLYDNYIGVRKFFDYGPTLFLGGQPDILTYLYIMLVVTSFFLGLGLTSLSTRIPLFIRWTEHLINIRLEWIVIALIFLIVTITAITTDSLYTVHFRYALYLLACLSSFVFLIKKPFLFNKIEALISFAKYIFILIFIAILLFNLPKVPVLIEIFFQSDHKKATTGLFLGMSFFALGLGYFITRLRSRSERLILSLILASIYIISIRESWIYWGLDAFHEGESFLSVNLLINSPYKFLVDFFPVHGLGRNILHSYFASIFSESNLYFYRVVKAITYPFIHVLIFAVLYRYTKKLTIPLGFFVISYLLSFIEELDIEPFLLIAFLMVPLTVKDINNTARKVVVGVMLFMASIYSLEYFVFLNIAMAITFIHHFYIKIRFGKQPIPWMHIAFYLSSLVFVVALGSRFIIWVSHVLSAIEKSPNLLERSLVSPNDFSLTFFLLCGFFVVFLLFHLASIVTFLRKSKNLSAKSMLVAIFSMLSLMFFVRAFNRSDIGHVMYAYSISIPMIIALTIHYKLITERTIVLILFIVLIINGWDMYRKHNTLSIDTLKQRPNYDSRLNVNDVQPIQSFGSMQVPAGVISDAQMNTAELEEFQSLVKEGYRFFDMTNQPVLIYGAVKSPLVTDDIYTIFYNSYREQLDVINKLKHNEQTLILWTAGHWSETLDYTYVEYRLPILSSYIISSYPHTYRVGRFVILSQQSLNREIAEGNMFREKYDLGFAPSRMGPYNQEYVTSLLSSEAELTNYRESKPDALLIETNAIDGGQLEVVFSKDEKIIGIVTFKVPIGDSNNFIRLSNLPFYIRSNPDSIKVLKGDAGAKIKNINYLKILLN